MRPTSPGRHRPSASPSSRTDPNELAKIRSWAAENGHEVSSRGRISGLCGTRTKQPTDALEGGDRQHTIDRSPPEAAESQRRSHDDVMSECATL
ncbi:histone-like nucleoid-structuring protein Lsr2 [Curtobacterium sp. PhB172]|uniref:Lsr2 family DNA-binding protein n=1 Tax=Curtobacterium sp. PhB172 TaxID=2485196 RepID=UPI00288ADC50|nr:histone-like nucleoid-structuring protein Lsr2 [Curtobacterium sp. PhB172]